MPANVPADEAGEGEDGQLALVSEDDEVELEDEVLDEDESEDLVSAVLVSGFGSDFVSEPELVDEPLDGVLDFVAGRLSVL
jgi:hypothetical protein